MYYYDRWSFAGDDSITIGLYRALASWTEGSGTGQGGSARSGAAWYYRHAYPDNTQWYNAGARGAGHDRLSSADATQTITTDTSYGWITWTSSALRDSVAAWYANPASNFGWVMDYTASNDQNGVIFWSREGGGGTWAPGLEISYTGSIYWTGSQSGTWDVNTTANWRATTSTNVKAKFTNGDTAIFDDTASGTKTVTIQSGGVSVGGVLVNTTGTYTFSGGPIGGSGASLTKSGSGVLVLANASNTYTGSTNINGGTLRLGASNVLPQTPVNITNATLDLNGYSDTVSDLTLSSGTVTGAGTLSLGGNLTSSGTSSISGGTLSLPHHRTFTVSSGTLTIGSSITGVGCVLTKAGSGTLIFTNPANSYSGGTNINGGTLRLGASNVIPDYVVGITNATLDLNGFSDTIGGLTLSAGTITGAGTLTLGGDVTSSGSSTISGGTLALGASRTFNVADTLTIASAITGPGYSLTKTGPGTLILSNSANSYSGGTNINGGVLRLGASNVLPDYAVSISNATLELPGGVETIGALSLSNGTVTGSHAQITLGGNVTSSGASTISGVTVALGGDRTFHVDGALSTLTIASTITGAAGLTKTGSGTLTFSGSTANIYTGSTTVNGGLLFLSKQQAVAIPGNLTIQSGTVQLGSNENIADTALVSLADAGAFALYDPTLAKGYTETIGGLSGSGKVLLGQLAQAGRLIVDSTTNHSFSGEISGNGDFVKRGTGTQTLAGQCTHRGITEVLGGTLRLAGTGVLSQTAQVLVAQDAVLVVDGQIYPLIPVEVYGMVMGTGQLGVLNLQSGGIVSPGGSPGQLTMQSATWMAGGNYHWQIYDAAGQPGQGYDTLLIQGALDLTQTENFNINLWTLSSVNPDQDGPCIHFDPNQPWEWVLATAMGGIQGFDPNDFIIWVQPHNGAGGFANDLAGGVFSVDVRGNDLVLQFTPASGQIIPEPATATLLLLGLLGLAVRHLWRRLSQA